MIHFINKATVQGNLGNDPVTKLTKKGEKFAILSIATTTEYLDKNGIKKKFVEWHEVVVFDQFLNLLARGNFRKGDLIKVEGELNTGSWEDENGKTHKNTQIVVRSSKVHNIEKINFKEEN